MGCTVPTLSTSSKTSSSPAVGWDFSTVHWYACGKIPVTSGVGVGVGEGL